MQKMQAQPLFAFEIAEIVLAVTPQDSEVILDAAFSTGLGHDDYSSLLTRAFAKVLGNPLSSSVSKPEFDQAMRELLPEVGGWSPERKEHLSFFLSHLFYSFDRADKGAVPTDELLVALCFLCGGNKTAKLAFAFALFDSSDGSDALEQAELARLLATLLTTLFAFCSASNDLPEKMVVDSVHSCAVRTVLDLYSELGLDDQTDTVSFDHFGAWYNRFGFETIQWLELLDLSKWPGAAEVRAGQEWSDGSGQLKHAKCSRSFSPRHSPGSPRQAPGSPPSSPDSAVISFDFPAPCTAKVEITERDVGRFSQLLNLTETFNMAPQAVSEAFLQAVAPHGDGLMDLAAFKECIGGIVDFQTLLTEAALDEKEMLQVSTEINSRFCAFFFAFERHRGMGANVDELAAGLSLLCQGSKSEKLAHAWEILTSQSHSHTGSDEDRLTRRGLWRFLRSFLQVLMAVSSAASSSLLASGPEAAADFFKTADAGAVWTAALIFDEAQRLEEDSISFDEFAEWYTSGGYSNASWFELLDLNKWVMSQAEDQEGPHTSQAAAAPSFRDPGAPAAGDYNGLDYEEEEEEEGGSEEDVPSGGEDSYQAQEDDEDEEDEEEYESTDSEDDFEDEVVFSFSLTDSGHFLHVTSADAFSVLRLSCLSGLELLAVSQVADALAANSLMDPASGEKFVTLDGFNSALRVLLPDEAGSNPTGSGFGFSPDTGANRSFLATALGNVFFAFVTLDADADEDEEECAPLAELTVGLSLFAQGSKSAKLQSGFGCFLEGGEEKLSGPKLARFVGAVLTVLFACAEQTAKLPTDQARALAQVAAQRVVRRVVTSYAEGGQGESGQGEGGQGATFEDFGDWYNSEGCETSPWLELLDLKKWGLEASAASAAAAASKQLNPEAPPFDYEALGGEADGRPSTARGRRETTGGCASPPNGLQAQDGPKAGYESEGSSSESVSSEESEGSSEALDTSDESEEDYAGFGGGPGGYSDDYVGYRGTIPAEGQAVPAPAVAGLDDSATAEEDPTRFAFSFLDSTGEAADFVLRLTVADVSALAALAGRTGLESLSPKAVCGPILRGAQADGKLEKKTFDSVVRTLVDGDKLSQSERSSFSVLLSAVFYNFEASDRDFGGCADALELAIGMTLLCAGDKSAKLNFAWQVMDEDEDGLLDRTELLFFLRAIIRMLMALSFEASALGPNDARRVATDMASWLSSTVLERFSEEAAGLPKRVSFEGFAEWYQQGFHKVVPWLELLDLKKWGLSQSA